MYDNVERPPVAASIRYWLAAIGSGLIAGVGMGLALQFGTGLLPLLGAVVGLPSTLGGWLVHLGVSVVFALLFVAVVSRPLLRDYTTSREALVGLGVAHGALLGFFTGGILLPLAVNPVRGTALPVPLLPIPGLVGDLFTPFVVAVAHLVYGALLGLSYAYFTRPR